MRRISTRLVFTTLAFLPGILGAQQRSASFSPDADVRYVSESVRSMRADSQRTVDRAGVSVVFGPIVRSSAQPAALAAVRQFGVHYDSRLPHANPIAEFQWLSSASRVSESSQADTNGHESNRSMHIVIGVVSGVVAGVLLGKAVDKGRAGCGHEQSGTTCDFGSGLYEPLLGLIGGAIGGIVGASFPHN
jgi:hypothetical protein